MAKVEERNFDLQDRLIDFAVACALISEQIQNTAWGRYSGNQVLRSSGSSALNYGEVMGAQTDRDYINKAGLVLKELKESRASLTIISRLDKKGIIGDGLLDENEQLIRIIARLIKNRKG